MKIVKRATSVAVSFIALLAMTIPAQAFATTDSVDSVSSVKACDSLGKHKGVVAPCNVINMQRKHGKLPTDTIGLVEVRR